MRISELPFLTHDHLMSLLAEVDDVIAAASSTPEPSEYGLFVIGGAAIGRFADSRLTQDLDVANDDLPEAVLSAASIVAGAHNMPDGWINNQAAATLEGLILSIDLFDLVWTGKHLLIYMATLDTLLALKLLSGRGKDVYDILDLAARTGIVYYESLMDLCDSTFARSPRYQHEREWVSAVARDIHALLALSRTDMLTDEAVAKLVDQCDGLGPLQ